MMRLLFLLMTLNIFSSLAWSQKKHTNNIRWSIAGELPAIDGEKALGLAGPIAGVYGHVMLIGGGANFPDALPWNGGKKVYYDKVYAFQTEGDNVLPLGDPFTLPFRSAYGANCSTPQGIVYAGGENEKGLSAKVYVLRWTATGVVVDNLPDLPFAVANASMTRIGDVLYLAGGETADKVADQFLSLDLSNPLSGWKALPPLPKPVSHAVLVSQSNGDHTCIYLSGGRKKNANAASDVYASVFEFDPKTSVWKSKAELPYALAAGTGVATGASYILMFGGDKGQYFRRAEELLAAIAGETDPIKRAHLTAEKTRVQSSHPGFNREVLLYNTITDVWSVTDTIPFDAQVTTTALQWGKDFIIPTGEVKPGIRTPHIVKGSVSRKQFLSWPDLVVLGICFLLMTVARYYFTSSKTTTSDYFKGGQKIPQWAAGISIFGAKLSAITFMGIPAKTYGTDWTYFFLLMTIIMIMPIVVRFFIPFYRSLNVTSAYEYLDKRFNYGSRVMASLLYILLQLGRMGIVVLLPSIALTLVTGINVNLCILIIGVISIFFTVKGGIEAVIWVEVVQVLILAGGALLCLFYIPFNVGAIGSALESVQDYEKLKVFDFRFTFSDPTFWVVVIGGLAISLVTYGTDQTTVQRYLTTKTEKESVRSLRIGAWLTLPSTLVFFSLGTLLFLFFRAHPEQVNFTLQNQDNIFPWFIVSQLPLGLSGLLIAGIFAAAMSSTEASMNSVATLLTADFYKKLRPAATEKSTLLFARIATLLLGLFVTGIALYMAQQGVSSLWDKFNTILGLFTGSIGGVFLLGIFTKKANGPGVVTGMIASCIVQLLIQQYTSVHLLMYAFTGLASCVTLGYAFSLLMGGQNKNIDGLTIYDRDPKDSKQIPATAVQVEDKSLLKVQ